MEIAIACQLNDNVIKQSAEQLFIELNNWDKIKDQYFYF